MARNRDRLGTRAPTDEAPPSNMLQDNQPGFSFVVPTDFVELPSQGRYYPENHPLHGQQNIEIKQMTAKEEDILTSRTLLRKGIALDRVIQSVILDKRINPDTVLVGDRNAIIVAMRIAGYGSDYTTKVVCPACQTSQEHTFYLHEASIYRGEDSEGLGVTDNKNGTFDVLLPRTKVTVTFKLLTGQDEKQLLKAMEGARKRKAAEKTITTQLRSMIVAVNGDNSPEAIKYLIDNIPSMDSRHLRLAYRLSTPNVDLTQTFECAECGHEGDMEVPLTAEFFWPNQ
mgnify:CR=1 FL=1